MMAAHDRSLAFETDPTLMVFPLGVSAVESRDGEDASSVSFQPTPGDAG